MRWQLKLWFLRWGYRPLMRLAHRFNWHYAPMSHPLYPTGETQRWCQWCGFRESYPALTKGSGLSGAGQAQVKKTA